MLKISEIFIYPIKSLGGISVQQAEVTDRGFKYDRRWMLVDSNNRFLSQREIATMALLKVSLSDTSLKITNTVDETISIPFTPSNDEFIEVIVWDDSCRAQLVSREADEWFTKVLGINCRLVYMPDNTKRHTDTRYTTDDSITSFSDAYPFMIIGQASLDELNSHLDEKLPINRFRPNMVFTGGTPYQEDLINEFSINDIHFNGVKLCARCNVTTINQTNASKGKEPLKTLAGYRSRNKKIYFGQNVVHSDVGVISICDELIVLSTHTEERFIIS